MAKLAKAGWFTTPMVFIVVGLSLSVFGSVARLSGQSGSVQGDVYLATQGGEVRKFAATRVYLVPLSVAPDLAHPACAKPDVVLHALEGQRSSSTGMNAHFAFTDVPSGRYLLYADIPMRYFWLVPVRVTSSSISLDLDNTNVTLVEANKEDEIANAVCVIAAATSGSQ